MADFNWQFCKLTKLQYLHIFYYLFSTHQCRYLFHNMCVCLPLSVDTWDPSNSKKAAEEKGSISDNILMRKAKVYLEFWLYSSLSCLSLMAGKHLHVWRGNGPSPVGSTSVVVPLVLSLYNTKTHTWENTVYTPI